MRAPAARGLIKPGMTAGAHTFIGRNSAIPPWNRRMMGNAK
jgi:hypothetical protein